MYKDYFEKHYLQGQELAILKAIFGLQNQLKAIQAKIEKIKRKVK